MGNGQVFREDMSGRKVLGKSQVIEATLKDEGQESVRHGYFATQSVYLMVLLLHLQHV